MAQDPSRFGRPSAQKGLKQGAGGGFGLGSSRMGRRPIRRRQVAARQGAASNQIQNLRSKQLAVPAGRPLGR